MSIPEPWMLGDAIMGIGCLSRDREHYTVARSTATTRTTLALPSDLLERVDAAVRAGKARSRNALIAEAIRRVLHAQDRAEIDAQFAAMAEDSAYQAEATQIASEFAAADWEALRSAESA
jgi:Arc/MetJ-type ribon-helix-helix transcriptional regulator